MSAAEELAGLDRVLTRLAVTEDVNLEQVQPTRPDRQATHPSVQGLRMCSHHHQHPSRVRAGASEANPSGSEAAEDAPRCVAQEGAQRRPQTRAQAQSARAQASSAHSHARAPQPAQLGRVPAAVSPCASQAPRVHPVPRHAQVLEILAHVNKRLKANPAMPLPLTELVSMACGGQETHPMVCARHKPTSSAQHSSVPSPDSAGRAPQADEAYTLRCASRRRFVPLPSCTLRQRLNALRPRTA